jgi:4-amino-4-deoxy-L-arabinose transferase-like glycosyltransferase
MAGAMVGLGFMLKGFMIFVCIAALLPYLIFRQRYLQVLLNPGVYFGLVLGSIPPVGWLTLSYYKYGITPVNDLFGKLLFLSKTDTYNPSPIYYFWNLPANIFPWALFSIIGVIVIWRKLLPDLNYSVLSLTLGYPIALFLLLSMFRTRMPYYTMQLLPFMGLLAGTAFIHFTQISRESIKWYRLITWLSYAFSGLGILLAIIGILSIINPQLWGIVTIPNIQIYSIPAIILGSGWATIPILWKRWQPQSTPYWIASWIVPAWFTMVAFALQGAWTDKNPEFKAPFYQMLSDSAIIKQPINLLIETHNKNKQSHELSGEELKTLILITFYTPNLGKQMTSFSDLPDRGYAWTLNVDPELINKTRSLAKVQEWQLIQKLKNS